MEKNIKPKYVSINLERIDTETRNLSLAEVGAIHRLIYHACRHEGKIPADDDELRRIVGAAPMIWKQLRPKVVRFLEPTDGGYKTSHADYSLRRTREIYTAATHGGRAKSLKYQRSDGADGTATGTAKTVLKIVSSKEVSSSKEDRPSSLTTTSLEETLFPAAPEKEYFYENGLVRLNEKDFRRWERAYPKLNLLAELETLAHWDQLTPKNWFHAIPQVLRRRNEELERTNGVKYFSV